MLIEVDSLSFDSPVLDTACKIRSDLNHWVVQSVNCILE